MSDEQTKCSRCGAVILVLTARERAGLCVPCSRGERERIEDGKRRHQEWKKYLKSPPYLFWQNLVTAVHRDGLDGVPSAERDYYAIGVLQGEVFNGGFHQYFSNSSGDLFDLTVSALERLGAGDVLKVLLEAKQLVFGANPVPEWARRNAVLDQLEGDTDVQAGLSTCGDRFNAMDRMLSGMMEEFAIRSGFYPKQED